MEPSDFDFARSKHFLDEHGAHVDLGSSIGSRRSMMSRSHRRERQLSRMSRWSDNTLVRSVLLADGLFAAGDEEDHIQELPSRYAKGSVKSKLTWFGILCLAGVGMFVEAYMIITTGQVKTVWHENYPECWDSHAKQPCPNHIQCCGLFPNTPESVCENSTPNDVCTSDNEYPSSMLCTERQLGGVSYAEFAGIMGGMLLFGYIADLIGRKRAGMLTAFLMIGGATGMAFFEVENTSTLFLVFSVFFAIFGLGTGGEYPLTATQAAEHHEESAQDALMDDEETRHQRLLLERAKTARRGETITLVFAMQGVGAVVGSIFLLSLIYFSNQTRARCNEPYTNSKGGVPDALEGIWRTFYFIGLIFVAMLFVYRYLVLEEGEGFKLVQERREKRKKKLGAEVIKQRYWKTFWFYFPRLIGTGGNWLLCNVFFYGLKLFSGPIFADINPGGDLVVQNGYLLINNLCALAGYYCAAVVIDRHDVGRTKLQMFSFGLCGFIFMLTAGIFDSAPTGLIIFLFFASSFFGNFGANVTTYVMAAETFPTELRGTFHGLSAFLGKVGALGANIGFSYLSSKEIFWVCGGCGIAGVICTYVFSVDLTCVSLAEHDAQLELLYAGRIERYKGKLNDPKHLSNFERWTGKHGKFEKEWVHKLVGEEKATTHPINREIGVIMDDANEEAYRESIR